MSLMKILTELTKDIQTSKISKIEDLYRVCKDAGYEGSMDKFYNELKKDFCKQQDDIKKSNQKIERLTEEDALNVSGGTNVWQKINSGILAMLAFGTSTGFATPGSPTPGSPNNSSIVDCNSKQISSQSLDNLIKSVDIFTSAITCYHNNAHQYSAVVSQYIELYNQINNIYGNNIDFKISNIDQNDLREKNLMTMLGNINKCLCDILKSNNNSVPSFYMTKMDSLIKNQKKRVDDEKKALEEKTALLERMKKAQIERAEEERKKRAEEERIARREKYADCIEFDEKTREVTLDCRSIRGGFLTKDIVETVVDITKATENNKINFKFSNCTIEEFVFANSDYIDNVTIDSGVTVCKFSFADATINGTVNICPGVIIERYSFSESKISKDLKIGGYNRIVDGAFYGATIDGKVIIGDDVDIGEDAFLEANINNEIEIGHRTFGFTWDGESSFTPCVSKKSGYWQKFKTRYNDHYEKLLQNSCKFDAATRTLKIYGLDEKLEVTLSVIKDMIEINGINISNEQQDQINLEFNNCLICTNAFSGSNFIKDITFNDNVEILNYSFEKAIINGTVLFNNNIILGTNSFYRAVINGNVLFKNNNITLKSGSFDLAKISGDVSVDCGVTLDKGQLLFSHLEKTELHRNDRSKQHNGIEIDTIEEISSDKKTYKIIIGKSDEKLEVTEEFISDMFSEYNIDRSKLDNKINFEFKNCAILENAFKNLVVDDILFDYGVEVKESSFIGSNIRGTVTVNRENTVEKNSFLGTKISYIIFDDGANVSAYALGSDTVIADKVLIGVGVPCDVYTKKDKIEFNKQRKLMLEKRYKFDKENNILEIGGEPSVKVEVSNESMQEIEILYRDIKKYYMIDLRLYNCELKNQISNLRNYNIKNLVIGSGATISGEIFDYKTFTSVKIEAGATIKDDTFHGAKILETLEIDKNVSFEGVAFRHADISGGIKFN